MTLKINGQMNKIEETFVFFFYLNSFVTSTDKDNIVIGGGFLCKTVQFAKWEHSIIST